MYVILTSWPKHGDGNVGDRLLLEQAKYLIEKETGISEFEVYFLEHDFTSHTEKLNEATAIILPAFVILDSAGEPHDSFWPLHPSKYTLAEDLDEIDTPIIPLASTWQTYPGDKIGNESVQYSRETMDFLKYLNNQPELTKFTARDIYTKKILKRHGFDQSIMVGDLAWYHEDYMNQDMRIPTSIDEIVMTTPHHSVYEEQAKRLINMVSEEFPEANVTLSFHSRVNLTHEKNLRRVAQAKGFDIVYASHQIENVEFYDQCDLHIGYRLHGHLSFLRRRLPSVLLAEDGRGNGFNATLGTAGFPAMDRRLGPKLTETVYNIASTKAGKGARMAASMFINEPIRRLVAPPDEKIPEKVQTFLRQERENKFESYEVVPELFDSTYKQAMQPFLQSLPK
jgi:hypothetical protein